MKKQKNKRTGRPAARESQRRIDINVEAIDFRNTDLLRKFTTESGRILPRRITGMPAKLHRRLTREIKRARNVLLMK
ncbi:30S ribosomal protein S18 [Methylacidimicrobium sp. AP8]|uniref:30S ribosomal protein S18 n=1 Tax=Methylacidimicrobium sp. AP8 TaxID=2730359 RepID=UPI0018BFBE84|nr:30S ribosomal protein S18 [Methylacidimicrobium sp. AP8]CAB4244071.1 30S ribosomal protein S18 [Methylacidimicrobium sp. AP8]